ncbi:MAG: hypothetical protein U5K81_02625 [Trueperaceae bacterium]|nr:hypothetical protein [Trueperaceae bacterium]
MTDHANGARPRVAWLARAAACLAALAFLGSVAHADPTYYVNTARDAPAAFLTLDLADDGTLHGRVLGDPARHGAMARTFGADVQREGGRVRAVVSAELAGAPAARLPADGRWTTTTGQEDAWSLTVEADAGADDASLDPFGTAQVTWPGGAGRPRGTTTFRGIGATVHERVGPGDGPVGARRSVPRFHASPWRELDLAATLGGVADAMLQDPPPGAQGDDGGDVSARQVVRTTALTDSLVSVLVVQYAPSGDVEAPTRLASWTWVGDGRAWRAASACQAARALVYPCDEAALRAAVVAAVEQEDPGRLRMDAAPSLDIFTIGIRGITVWLPAEGDDPRARHPIAVRVPYHDLRP